MPVNNVTDETKSETTSAVELAPRFMELFAGLDRVYGTYVLDGRVSDKGKREGKGVTRQEPVTLELWKAHLAGEQSLGIVPIREDGTCTWGAIDIDSYNEFDLLGLIQGIQGIYKNQRTEPLLAVCRSKSGGAHCMLFAEEPVPAELMRARLKELATLMWYPDAEIFPKQSTLRPGENGSWLNIPYFANGSDGRYAVKPDGTPLSAGKFLEMADTLKRTRRWFDTPICTPSASGGPGDRRTDGTSDDASPRVFRKKELYRDPGGRDNKLYRDLMAWWRLNPEKSVEQGLENANLIVRQMADPPGAEELRKWNVPDKVRRTQRRAAESSEETVARKTLWTTGLRSAVADLNIGIDAETAYGRLKQLCPKFHADELEDIIAIALEKAKPPADAPAAKLWAPGDLKPFRDRGFGEVEYLVEGVLQAGTVAVFGGAPGCGKSTILFSICHAISRGVPWAGRAVNKRPVLILDRENAAHYVGRMLDRFDIQDGPDFIVNVGADEVPPPGPDSVELVQWVKSCDPKPVIVFDTVRAFLNGGDENDSTVMRGFIEPCAALRDAGATVCLIHHTGKNGDLRGSSDIVGGPDWIWLIESHNAPRLEDITFRGKKIRGLAEPFGVRYNAAAGTFNSIIAPSSAVMRERDIREGVLGNLLRENVGISKGKFEEKAKKIHGTSQGDVREFVRKGTADGWIVNRGTKTYSALHWCPPPEATKQRPPESGTDTSEDTAPTF